MALQVGDTVYCLEDTPRLGFPYALRGRLESIGSSPAYGRGRVRSYIVRLADGSTVHRSHRGSIGIPGREMQLVRKVLPNIRRKDGNVEPLPCFDTHRAAHDWGDDLEGTLASPKWPAN